jgi:UDP-N-acetylmuramoyl-tripeptide--D-alanyl-D-alanine ligase
MKSLLKQFVISILRLEARVALWRHRPFIIAVTGSVGKTTTKEFIGAVMTRVEGNHSVRVSEKSMNSEIGLPLAILGLENAWGSPLGWMKNMLLGLSPVFSARFPKFLVLEVGADQPGDIRGILGWFRADVVVVTRLPDISVHVENYPSLTAVQEEEWALVDALRGGGLAVLNGDDPNIMARRQRIQGAQIVTYGFGSLAAVRASEPAIDYSEREGRIIVSGMRMTLEVKGVSATIGIDGVLGRQAPTAALAAVAVGIALGYELSAIVEGIAAAELPRGRMRILPGAGATTLIDDTYNASPVAVEAALRALGQVQIDGRKVAILGDMLELGEYSEDEHRKIGRLAKETVNLLLVVGKRAKWISDEAKKAGMDPDAIMEFDDSDAAGEWMRGHLEAGDLILLKGSQGSGANKIRMERATKRLLLVPEIAPLVLVRQEAEWQKR